MNPMVSCPVCNSKFDSNWCPKSCSFFYYDKTYDINGYWFKQIIDEKTYRFESGETYFSQTEHSTLYRLGEPWGRVDSVIILRLNNFVPFEFESFKSIIPRLLKLKAFS